VGRDHGRNDTRNRIAHLAARLMAEDGIEDYARAKRKAARQAGMLDARQLPSNEEVEAALRVHQNLYQQPEHDERLQDLRRRALQAMRAFSQFDPHLTGPVLRGNAGRYAGIELYLFTDNDKSVEHFLIERGIPYKSSVARLYLGDQPCAVPAFTVSDGAVDVEITVLPGLALRVPLRSSPAGKAIEHAKLRAVEELLASGTDAG
jgi:hypothetical protein